MKETFKNLAQDPSSLTALLAHKTNYPIDKVCHWRWHMQHQLRSFADLRSFFHMPKIDNSLDEQYLEKTFHLGMTPYYALLMQKHPSIRIQAFPHFEELTDSWGSLDPLEEVGQSPVEEVIHIYPDRVAFCVSQLCPVYCRYCFRKRRNQNIGRHFNRQIIDRGLSYIASTPSIKDVLITGGDPLIIPDPILINLLQRLRRIPHVEVLRIGTRTPVALPYRLTAEFTAKLAQFQPLWLNTHFNCAEELTPEATLAIRHLVDAGIPVGNQSVLLKGVNDSFEKMLLLLQTLIRHRIRPYYLFHPHRILGNTHLYVSVRQGLKIMQSIRGRISGYAIPVYAFDTPSGKIPLQTNYILGIDGQDLILSGLRGEIRREKNVYF